LGAHGKGGGKRNGRNTNGTPGSSHDSLFGYGENN